MAFTLNLLKSTNSLFPLAIRLTQVQRNYHSSISTALNSCLQSKQPPTNRLYSNSFRLWTAVASKKPSATESLIRFLESEIQCLEESLKLVGKTPMDFPFEIKVNPRIQTVTLTREYDGELVKVDVHMDDLDGNEDDDDDDEKLDYKYSFPFVVTVSKKDGASLEFKCDAFYYMIQIQSLSFRNPNPEGPDFDVLDKNLQNGFMDYLEMRGIKPSITNFLCKYINKDKIEYVRLLKNLKKFVEA